jgi:hypothetical protein
MQLPLAVRSGRSLSESDDEQLEPEVMLLLLLLQLIESGGEQRDLTVMWLPPQLQVKTAEASRMTRNCRMMSPSTFGVFET